MLPSGPAGPTLTTNLFYREDVCDGTSAVGGSGPAAARRILRVCPDVLRSTMGTPSVIVFP